MLRQNSDLFVYLLLAIAPSARSTISENFRAFIRDTYGIGSEQIISRDDLGWIGSFGGGNHKAGMRTRHVPIIYVHGAMASAGEMSAMRNYFLSRGYADEEVYGTSYGRGKLDDMDDIVLKCVHVKGVRALIHAVSVYTNSMVDVVAYSMGAPVARKALLGGQCVDTGDNLGAPLTDIVLTFLSVAGANHGSKLCENNARQTTLCNNVNGLSCSSKFYQDLNAREHYEGRNVFSVLSTTDELVGRACGVATAEIRGANDTITLSGYSHYSVLYNTAPMQYNLINFGVPSA